MELEEETHEPYTRIGVRPMHAGQTESVNHEKKPKRFVEIVLNNWKILLIIGNIVVLFLITFFLVLFLVILKPSEDKTGSTIKIESTTLLPESSTTRMATSTLSSSTKLTTYFKTTTAITTKMPLSCNRTIKESEKNSICTNGFQLVGNKCLKLFNDPLTKGNADAICKKVNGGSALVSLKNREDRDAVLDFLQYKTVQKFWIGLECKGETESSCTWDHRRGTVSNYSNFKRGYPNVDFGYCVYYLVSVNKWVSANCDSDTFEYICELPPTTPDTCQSNYDNNCYTRIDTGMNFTSAAEACMEICSRIVTIHSELENQFVMSMFTIPGYLFLGGFAPSKNLVLWYDLSARDYVNFGDFNPSLSLIFMDYRTGKWNTENTDSVRTAWVVCKRPAGLEQ